MNNFKVGTTYRVLNNEAARNYSLFDLSGEEFIVAEEDFCSADAYGDECVLIHFPTVDLDLYVPFEAVEVV